MKNNSQTKIFVEKEVQGSSSSHPMLRIEIVRKILEDLKPEILHDPLNYQPELDLIEEYLFRMSGRKARHEKLKAIFGEDLLITLSGYKSLLINHKYKTNLVELGLEESKRQFKNFLEQEFEE